MRLSIKNLTVKYGEKTILQNIGFDVCEGEILGIFGGNGTGKSTLCRCVAGLPPHEAQIAEGGIFFDGKNVSDMTVAEKAHSVGIIFQNPETQLFSPSVEDELAFAPENLLVPREEIEKRIGFALKICRIEHLRHASTAKLSGGEKQLVAIASVLTMQPKVLVADEITARVDREGREKIRACLKAFAAAGGAVLMVSHIESELEICSKIIVLKKEKANAD